jgi:hypothetical protein
LKPCDDSYAILLMTPKSDNGTFEYDLGQTLAPEHRLVGRPCVFYGKQNPTKCDWTHMVIYDLHWYQLPSMPELKQCWQFNFDLPQFFTRYSRAGGGIVNVDERDDGAVTEPPDLADRLREMDYTNDRFLYVLTLVEFTDAESEARYCESAAKLRKSHMWDEENEWTLHVQLARPITQSALTGPDPEQRNLPDTTDFVTLTSFASARKFGEWLMSEEHKKMVGEGDGEVMETMVLTQPIGLPPRKGWENYRYDVFGK